MNFATYLSALCQAEHLSGELLSQIFDKPDDPAWSEYHRLRRQADAFRARLDAMYAGQAARVTVLTVELARANERAGEAIGVAKEMAEKCGGCR